VRDFLSFSVSTQIGELELAFHVRAIDCSGGGSYLYIKHDFVPTLLTSDTVFVPSKNPVVDNHSCETE
jgi:hypothetical protein